MSPAREHHVAVTRTARYHTIGPEADPVTEVWFVLHGYGQLAGYFVRHFAPLDDGRRLIVAPEALNRFYLERTSWKGSGQARVGATWMTREDRLADIDDYVGYLDALYTAVVKGSPKVVVLGFSQGVSTATRWLCRGRARAHQLVLWAGPWPPEIDAAAAVTLRSTKVVRVLGDADEMAAPDVLVAEEERLRAAGIEAPLIRFIGGHEMNAEVLRSLAS